MMSFKYKIGGVLWGLALGTMVQAQSVGVWQTTVNGQKLLERQTFPAWQQQPAVPDRTIRVDTSVRFQEIEGFGASMTGSSAYLIKGLPSKARQALMDELFDVSKGIGLSYLRMSMGASDFSLEAYTYNDLKHGETDAGMKRFGLGIDARDVVPVLRQAVKVNPEIRLMGSPWSAPAWMKDSGKLEGGQLNPSAYDAYARYFVKYVKAMEKKGLAVDAVTIQNEPLYESKYPSMGMSAASQAEFIKKHLGPLFQANKLQTKIVVYDHNWDRPDYPIEILNDPEARKYVHGSAFHCYGGDVSAMGEVHRAHPDKALYFTECSGGSWAPNWGDNLMWYTRHLLIGTLNNWSRNVLMWNLALDGQNGPTTNKPRAEGEGNYGCMTCRGIVTIDSQTHQVTRNVEYYAFAQFSKFVRPGAFRVSSTQLDEGLQNVAFVNTDGSRVLVVLNDTPDDEKFWMEEGSRAFGYQVPAMSVSTFVWE
ncbi:MAG: glycoside hydrolase family 30 beta sandwich domain-containing protein [Breznakibacter sp.]